MFRYVVKRLRYFRDGNSTEPAVRNICYADTEIIHQKEAKIYKKKPIEIHCKNLKNWFTVTLTNNRSELLVIELKSCLKLDSNLQETESVGKNFKFGRGDRNIKIKAVEKNINWKKGLHYPLSFHIKAVGKNIKKGNGTENMVN